REREGEKILPQAKGAEDCEEDTVVAGLKTSNIERLARFARYSAFDVRCSMFDVRCSPIPAQRCLQPNNIVVSSLRPLREASPSSWLQPPQFAQQGFEPRNLRLEFLTRPRRRVTREVAGLEQFAQLRHDVLRRAARHESFLDYGFGDGRRREVEAFA